MKTIEVDDELYHYIASKTENIGEPASSILRRLLGFDAEAGFDAQAQEAKAPEQDQSQPAQSMQTPVVEAAPEIVAEPVKAPEPEVVEVAETVAEETPVEVAPEQAEEVTETSTEVVESDAAFASEEKAQPKKAKKTRKIAPRKLSADEQKEADEVAKLEPSAALGNLSLDELQNQHGAVGRFLYILSALEAEHGSNFASVVKIKGRDRLYFATSQDELLQSGSSTNPKRIGETSYWVITNNNTSRKKWMLSEVAKMLGYGETDLRILADKI